MVKLTLEGERLFKLAAPVIEEFENIGDEFAKIRGTLRGEAKIVSFGPMLSNVLPKILMEFRAKHPESEIFLFTGSANDIQSMVLSRTVDFGIGSMDELPEGIIGTEVWRSKRYLITPRDHRFVRRKNLSVKDLADVSIVMPNMASHTGELLLKELKRYNPNPKITVEASDWELVMRYVEMGFGISWLPEIVLQPQDKKRVHFKDFGEIEGVQPPDRVSRYGLLIRKGGYPSPIARELIKILCPEFDFDALTERRKGKALSN